MKKTLYQVLGVEAGATPAQIAEGYAQVQAALEAGPYNRNEQIIAKEAFAVLSNPGKRKRYDLSCAAARRPKPTSASASRKTAPDWRVVVVLALGLGALAGWWFSQPKPAPAVVAKPVAVAAPAPVPAPIVEAIEPELSNEDLFEKLAPSIVRINVLNAKGRLKGGGSGFVIAPQTVITNCHVAEAGFVLQVWSGGTSYSGTVALADQTHDLCRIDVPGLTAEPIKIGSALNLRTGQRVVAIGAPKGLDLTISEGIVSSLRPVDDGTLIQTTAPVSSGSSGGGLFDLHGDLVGVVTFQWVNGQNLNFAAPADWIETMQATQGNGIIAKLTGSTPVLKEDPKDLEATATALMPGRWSCRDAIRQTVYQMDFEPNGNMESRRDGWREQGRWRPVEDRIEIKPFRSKLIQVEYLLGDKLILNYGKGFRSVCSRL